MTSVFAIHSVKLKRHVSILLVLATVDVIRQLSTDSLARLPFTLISTSNK